jgi:sugar O-acyltransferase (sialic acid O-acetyltransferase NeuD family)
MKLIIYGNGKIAKIVYEYVKNEFDIICFTVPCKLITVNDMKDLPIYPFERIAKLFEPASHKMIIAVGYHQMNTIRDQRYHTVKSMGYKFINYIHPSVHRHDDLIIGESNIILDNVSIQPGVRIGNNNFIWSNSVIAHECSIENSCWIASGTVIGGSTEIRSGCFLGINASIGHNIIVNNNNFLGANTLITKSTDVNEVYMMNDSQKIRLDSQRFLKFSGI